MQLVVIDSTKGRYFYYHILPNLRSRGMEISADILPLEEVKKMDMKIGKKIICGDKLSGKTFKRDFIPIDDYLIESVSFSFTENNVEELMESIKCFRK